MTAVQGDLLADTAIDQAEKAADPGWLAAAHRAVREAAASGAPFTTDDLWTELSRLGVTTHEPRALGAVLRAAARPPDALVEQTGRYVKTRRPEAHSRPIPVWRGKQ